MSRRKRQDKSITLRRHFKERLLTRYGITINNKDIAKWVGMIQRNEGVLVMRQSLRVTVWDLMIENRKIRVVYDKNRKELITALPPNEPVNWLEYEKENNYVYRGYS